MAYYTSSEICEYSNNSWTVTGCSSSYLISDIKYVVDAWATIKFANNELKEVASVDYGHYKARLVTKEELQSIGWINCSLTAISCPKEGSTSSWMYNSNCWYWTLTRWNDSIFYVWTVLSAGDLNYNTVFSREDGAVRPVINIKKSAIPQS